MKYKTTYTYDRIPKFYEECLCGNKLIPKYKVHQCPIIMFVHACNVCQSKHLFIYNFESEEFVISEPAPH